LPPQAAKLNFFRAAFSLILRSKINENAALKNIIWRRKPPNEGPALQKVLFCRQRRQNYFQDAEFVDFAF